MKPLRLLAIALLLALSNLTHAQWVSIPDTNFATYLYNDGVAPCLQGNNTVGWQMDTTCPDLLTSFSLIPANKNITSLEGVQYFDVLEYLDVTGNAITYLPTLPSSLITFDCKYQSDTAFAAVFAAAILPASLKNLYCSDDSLTSLPVLPAGLELLDCEFNRLAGLPALPASLTFLDVTANYLTQLPTLPAGIEILYCEYNLLNSLPAIPPTMKTLACGTNPIQTLPALPPGLRELYCDHTGITSLPATLPDSLRHLVCYANGISVLPALPQFLEYLMCGGSFITTIPALPATLHRFDCSYMQTLTAIPALPAGLNILICSATGITSLPALPDSLQNLYIDYTQLTCLPELKVVKYFKYNNTPLTCLPNYPANCISSVPPLGTLPVCNLFNSAGCSTFWNITGKSYIDNNADCAFNTSDSATYKMKIQLWSNGSLVQQHVGSTEGYYSFKTPAYATYQVTVDTSNIPFRILCPSSGSLTSVISAADSMDFNMDFALECKPGFDLEARSVTTNQVFRPANFNTLEVAAGDASNFYSGHCAAGVSGTVTLSFTGPVKYIAPAGGALTPTVAGNTLTYTVADFGTVNFFTDFDIVTQTDTTAQAGQQVCFTLGVTPTSGDNNPANNVLTICFPVVNSYDPNDKQAYPAGNIDTLQEELVYTVRFQNTGNADAQHIYITDTLDANVRPETFELLAYSHAPMVQLDGNKLRFNFPNINLPDSFTNEPASHGYVQYRVKLKENLPIGTTINNTAFIYFDFNPPVITNTATNTVSVDIDTTVGIQAVKNTTQVSVYPNPASNMVTVTLGENVPNSIVTITDIVGRTVLQPVTLTNTRSVTLSTRQLPGGVYLVNIKSPQGMQVTKRLLVSR